MSQHYFLDKFVNNWLGSWFLPSHFLYKSHADLLNFGLNLVYRSRRSAREAQQNYIHAMQDCGDP